MNNISRIRYLISKPVLGPLFRRLGFRALRNVAASQSLSDETLRAFIDGLWRERYSQIRCDPWEFAEPFGQTKLEMILRMALHAASKYGVDFLSVPHLGRWEVKFQIRDRFSKTDSLEQIRHKWGERDVVYWNIVAGLTKWEKKLFAHEQLKGGRILDYGCNVGVLSHLALQHGAVQTVLVEVPGATLDFASSFLASQARALPVENTFPPVGLDQLEFDVAYCYHVLEHVPEPLAVVTKIHERLRPGGIFHVTYANLTMTEGGINLVSAQTLRAQILDWFRTHYEVVNWDEANVEYVLRKPRGPAPGA